MVKLNLILLIFESLSITSGTTKNFQSHPRVFGNANFVDLNLRGTDDYYGPLYIGSEYRQVEMVYDTASQWTLVNNEGLQNAELISNYDVQESTTAQVKYADADKTTPVTQNLEFGGVTFEGLEYSDKMCLYQVSN